MTVHRAPPCTDRRWRGARRQTFGSGFVLPREPPMLRCLRGGDSEHRPLPPGGVDKGTALTPRPQATMPGRTSTLRHSSRRWTGSTSAGPMTIRAARGCCTKRLWKTGAEMGMDALTKVVRVGSIQTWSLLAPYHLRRDVLLPSHGRGERVHPAGLRRDPRRAGRPLSTREAGRVRSCDGHRTPC